MRIAIIGSGISGLTVANKLSRNHAVTVYEAQTYVGGHTATVDVEVAGATHAIDTGFIVYNDRTYPNFIKLLQQLGVSSQATTMGFSMSCQRSGLEYSGAGLSSLFAQRKNIISPTFLRLVRDIVRFNSSATRDYDALALSGQQTLGEYLALNAYSQGFIDHYLAPMASAIWSTSLNSVLDFPILFFIEFFKNHGLLQLSNRPQWRTIRGGSREYIAPLIRPFKEYIHLNCAVRRICRNDNRIELSTDRFGTEFYDHVVIATHSDQALEMLFDASYLEQEILGAIPYVENSVVLHTDESILPSLQSTWSSWNYLIPKQERSKPVLTYNMNILQGIEADKTFCVTLNGDDLLDEREVLGRYSYSHPEFSEGAVAAQELWRGLNGKRNTWYCGAYWGNGFHEDGVTSALRVVEAMLHGGLNRG
ncbi:MAG: NAD(P)/FAD-dependent oxidoreductase [Pseudomonadales bacterium]